MLDQPRVRFALVFVIVALLGGTVVAAWRDHTTSTTGTPITITTPASASQDPVAVASGGASITDSTAASSTIFVHITGAVKAPNMYQLPAGARIADAIKIAGGAKDSADLNAINLAEKLQDGEKIYVPTHEDTKSIPAMADAAPMNGISGKPPADLTAPASATPTTDAPTMASSTKTSTSTASMRGKSAASTGSGSSKANKLTDPSQGTVNINTAAEAELMRLPGVGKTTAERIIAYRTTSPFKKPDDLMSVGGIGAKKFAKMQPFVRVN